VDRVTKILECIDLGRSRGLEIGALHHPILTRDRANVFYVDHADDEALKEKYEDHADVIDIVHVDFVWAERPLVEVVGGAEPFDFVIASHVIEHVPNPVGWLKQLSEVLCVGGILSLAIPDKRFCFDARRRASDVAEVLDAFLVGRRRPTLGAVFDFYSRLIEVDTPAIWADTSSISEPTDDEILRGWEWAQKATTTERYIDVHSWTFTPTSFLDILRTLMVLDLIDFEVATFHQTEPNELEFHVSLRKLPQGLDADERRARMLRSLPTVDGPRTSPVTIPLSRREARLIKAKRRVLGVVHRFTGRIVDH
jgi:SAM-dependent methyltransferase